jgi:hypothetical protein
MENFVDIVLLKKLMKRTLDHFGSPLGRNTSQADECSSSPAANLCTRACGFQIRRLVIRALADKTGIFYCGLQTAPTSGCLFSPAPVEIKRDSEHAEIRMNTAPCSVCASGCFGSTLKWKYGLPTPCPIGVIASRRARPA